MDIGDIMNGSEEGSQSSPDPGDQPTQGYVPLYPVSKFTMDFTSFLEEGPPWDPTRASCHREYPYLLYRLPSLPRAAGFDA
jgi:hypothetical protein